MMRMTEPWSPHKYQHPCPAPAQPHVGGARAELSLRGWTLDLLRDLQQFLSSVEPNACTRLSKRVWWMWSCKSLLLPQPPVGSSPLLPPPLRLTCAAAILISLTCTWSVRLHGYCSCRSFFHTENCSIRADACQILESEGFRIIIVGVVV